MSDEWHAPTGKALGSILDSTAKLNLWSGSVRSGKTVASLLRWVEFVTREAPPFPLIMSGVDRDTIIANCVEPLEDMLGGFVSLNRGTSTLRIGRRHVALMGHSTVRAERKIRGRTLAGAYIDEATLATEAFWRRVTDRLSPPGSKLFGTTNPDRPTHWLRRDWILRGDRNEIDMRTFRFRLSDNPHLDPEYQTELRRSHTGVWYQRYILGHWVSAEGAIWPTYQPDQHTLTGAVPPLDHAIVAIDYGTAAPFVALLIGIATFPIPADPTPRPRLVVAAEWRWDSTARTRQLTDQNYLQRLTTWQHNRYRPPDWSPNRTHPFPGDTPIPHAPAYVVDPSAASLIVALQTDRATYGGNNTVDYGLRSVASLFANHRIVLHESAVTLADEITGYGWDPTALERGAEQPVKDADHGPDALRYGVLHLWPHWRTWLTLPPPP